jgi:hypothetical protein
MRRPGDFNQSVAFTCNIVSAKVVQCVKGAAYRQAFPQASGMDRGLNLCRVRQSRDRHQPHSVIVGLRRDRF